MLEVIVPFVHVRPGALVASRTDEAGHDASGREACDRPTGVGPNGHSVRSSAEVGQEASVHA